MKENIKSLEAEPTQELTAGDLNRLRTEYAKTAKCSKCRHILFKDETDQLVCNCCVREAMEAEGFTYKD